MSTPLPQDAVPLAEVKRALVIKLRHHGDVLLATPVLSALKEAAPHCEVDALVYADTAAMVDGHPAVACLHTIDRQWKGLGPIAHARAEWQLLSRLRARRFDLVVHLTDHPRGAWLTRLLAARWAVAPKRSGKLWGRSFTHLYPRAAHPTRHTVESHLDALRRIGIQPADAARKLVIVPGAAAEQRVRELLARHGLASAPFVHLHPASRWMFKCWPAERNAQLCAALAAGGLPIVLTAAPAPAELQLVAAIRQHPAASSSRIVDLAGTLSLKELAALTAQARLFVGVDSAPMHIAAAVGTPTVALFGPSNEIEWGPWKVRHRVVASENHSCRPCGLDGCGGGKISECLTTLPVARVLEACRQLLGEPAPGACAGGAP